MVKTTALNVRQFVITAPPINHVLLASAINPYQRNVFFQIVDARLDFMIVILFLLIVKVITS